jgi:hypothetical protein
MFKLFEESFSRTEMIFSWRKASEIGVLDARKMAIGIFQQSDLVSRTSDIILFDIFQGKWRSNEIGQLSQTYWRNAERFAHDLFTLWATNPMLSEVCHKNVFRLDD